MAAGEPFHPLIYTMGQGELLLQHLLSTEGREGPRRTATATPFIHEGPRRTAKNCYCNTFFHEGPRRTAKNGNCNTFVHGGPRRTAKNGNCNTFCPRRTRRGAENCYCRTATATPFCTKGHGELLNGNCNTFCPRRATEDHGELLLQNCYCRTATAELLLQLLFPRRAAKKIFGSMAATGWADGAAAVLGR